MYVQTLDVNRVITGNVLCFDTNNKSNMESIPLGDYVLQLANELEGSSHHISLSLLRVDLKIMLPYCITQVHQFRHTTKFPEIKIIFEMINKEKPIIYYLVIILTKI